MKQTGRAITEKAFQQAWSTIFHAADEACRTHLGGQKPGGFTKRGGLIESIALLPNVDAENALKFGVDNCFRTAKPGYTVLEWSAAYQSVRTALGFRPLVILPAVSEISDGKSEKKEAVPAKVPETENPKAVALAKIVANVDELFGILLRNSKEGALFYEDMVFGHKIQGNLYALAAAVSALNHNYENTLNDEQLQKLSDKFETALPSHPKNKEVVIELQRALRGEENMGPCLDETRCAASRFASLASWVVPKTPFQKKNGFYIGPDRRKLQMVAMEAIEAEMRISGKNWNNDDISSVVYQLFDMAMWTTCRNEHDVSCRSLQLISELIRLSGKDKLDDYAHKDLIDRLPALKRYANMKQVQDAADEVAEAILAAA
jgi:hypothetical protein